MDRDFYFGADDHSARKIIMNFKNGCYQADLDGFQYKYGDNGIEVVCLMEYKHPCTKMIDVDLIKVQRAVAAKLEVPLFVMIYFTKPSANAIPPDGDGYGTAEQPAMFYLVPGNRKAWVAMTRHAPKKHWYTPLELARFMVYLRGKSVSDAKLAHLSNVYVEYPRNTKVDVPGLTNAFKSDP